MAPIPRARARGARRWRRELGGGVRQHPGSTTALRGLMASLALPQREAVESDGHARSTCGVRELRRPPVRRSVGQRAAAARRPTSIVCWWRSFVGGERAMLAAPRIGAARRRALVGRDPQRRWRRFAHFDTPATGHRAAACDQHDALAATRRHRCRPDGGCCGRSVCPRRALARGA